MQHYTTKSGVDIPIRPIPPYLAAKVQQAAQKEAEQLYPAVAPTYKTSMNEVFEHDDTTAETDEDKALLAAYREALANRTKHTNEKMLNLFLMRGVDVKLPEDDGWAKTQTWLGVEVPSDPVQKRLHYIQTELLESADDVSNLSTAIMGASGVAPEAVDAARASFRRELRQGPGEPGQPGAEVSPQEPGSQVVDILPFSRNGSSENVGAIAVPVGSFAGE